MNASDGDSGDNARLSYYLSFDDNVEREWSPLFAIDSDTGTITAMQSLDREQHEEYRFQVFNSLRCFDQSIQSFILK